MDTYVYVGNGHNLLPTCMHFIFFLICTSNTMPSRCAAITAVHFVGAVFFVLLFPVWALRTCPITGVKDYPTHVSIAIHSIEPAKMFLRAMPYIDTQVPFRKKLAVQSLRHCKQK